MNEPRVAVLALTVALLVPVPRELAAQLVSKIEAGQYTVSDGVLPTSALRLAPTIQFELPHATFRARGSALLSEQNLQIADGLVTGTFTSPTVYGVHAEMIGNASRAIDDRSLGNDQVDVQTRIHLLFNQHAGVWFGGGVARPWRVAVASSADVTDAGAWAKIGDALAKFGTATMTATFTNFSFTKMASVHDTGSAQLSCVSASPIAAVANVSVRPAFTESVGGGVCERQSRFSDLEASMHWDVGALELSAQTGYRFGDSYDVTADSKRWSAATATLWLNERIAIVGGGGRQPALPLRGLPARSFAMGGIELAYWPIAKGGVPVSLPRAALVKSFDMHPLTNAAGMQKIIIRVGGVETVDVMGDFSDWSPLTLARRGRDVWELSIPLSPGMHRINIRVDGGPWMAPPGIPTMRDSFNGDVGMIVVPADKSSK
jgi:hypothetical protein